MKSHNPKKLKMQALLSAVILVVGALLLIGKIYADSEPGAIPLALVLFGAGWHFYTRYKYTRRNHTNIFT